MDLCGCRGGGPSDLSHSKLSTPLSHLGNGGPAVYSTYYHILRRAQVVMIKIDHRMA